MKKINKIVSFISGIALSIQPLVSAMSSDSRDNSDVEDNIFSIKLDKEQKRSFYSAMNRLPEVMKMSEMQKKLKVKVLAKSIIEKSESKLKSKSKSKSIDIINKYVDDFMDDMLDSSQNTRVAEIMDCWDNLSPMLKVDVKDILFSAIDKSKEILTCASLKKNKTLDSIISRRQKDGKDYYLTVLYVIFDAINERY